MFTKYPKLRLKNAIRSLAETERIALNHMLALPAQVNSILMLSLKIKTETGESRRMQSSTHPRTCFTNIWCLKSLINIETRLIHGLDFLMFNTYLLSFCLQTISFLFSLPHRELPRASISRAERNRRGSNVCFSKLHNVFARVYYGPKERDRTYSKFTSSGCWEVVPHHQARTIALFSADALSKPGNEI